MKGKKFIMNKSILLGRLVKNPEIKYSQSNNMKVANFTLAVNRKYVKLGEERQTDFINIVAYSNLAEFVEKYLKQGLQICICGRIQSRTWEDSNGQRRYATEVIAEEIDFADSPKKSSESTLWNDSITNNQTAKFTENTDKEIICSNDEFPF